MDFTNNVSKKELFNARVNSEKAEEYIGKELKVLGLAEYQDKVHLDDGTEEIRPIAVIVGETYEGEKVVISSPSATLVDSIEKLDDLFSDCQGDGEDLKVTICERKSNNGRKYYTLTAL